MKIKIKSGVCPEYLTEGKEYEVAEALPDNGGGRLFLFDDDDGDRVSVIEFGCFHLGGGNWEVIDNG